MLRCRVRHHLIYWTGAWRLPPSSLWTSQLAALGCLPLCELKGPSNFPQTYRTKALQLAGSLVGHAHQVKITDYSIEFVTVYNMDLVFALIVLPWDVMSPMTC
eukprot:5692465-Amphidinium_carterae.1